MASSPVKAQVLLLPFLELSAIHAAINLDDRWSAFEPRGAGNATVARIRIGLFLCPNDAEALRAETGTINDRTNNGLSQVPPEWNRGAFVEGANSLAGFSDGLSHTVAMSEKLVGSGRAHHFSGLRDWIFAPLMVIPGTSDDWLACCSNLPRTLRHRS